MTLLSSPGAAASFQYGLLHLRSVTHGRMVLRTVKASGWHSGADAQCKAGQRLSDPAVAANNASLSWAVCLGCGAFFLFPRAYLFVNMKGKNTFVWVLREGFTISEVCSTPALHCIQTLVSFQWLVPLFFKSLVRCNCICLSICWFYRYLRTAQTKPMGTEEFFLSPPLQ